MYLDEQEKVWLKAITDENVNNIETFITKFCDYDNPSAISTHSWAAYRFNQNERLIPKDEDIFLKQLYSFTSLVDKLIGNDLVTFGIKFVGHDDLLPIFRKGQKSFIEVWELLVNKQGLLIYITPKLKEFVENNFITREETRILDEQSRRINSERWIRRIAITAIIAQSFTALFLYYLETNREENLTKLSQELSYLNAVAQRKILYSEKILEGRAKAIRWLDKYQKEENISEKKKLLESWSEIGDLMGVTNSTSLMYSNQPYNAIMNFDDLFGELARQTLGGSLADSLYDLTRKEVGKRYDILISWIRENTTNDSAYINFLSGQRLDTKRIIKPK